MRVDFGHAVLGRTGITVGRLGVSASYGVPAAAVEEAFERGVNYLYWGSRRTGEFAAALRNLRPRRAEMVLVIQSYSRVAGLVRWSVERALRAIGYDSADVLLLGMWNKMPPARIMDAALDVQQSGLVRYLAVSTHNRRLAPSLAERFDVIHFRYNAVHTGAERDIFSAMPPNPPGLVSFTSTSWRQLLRSRRIPAGERRPTAADAYRFVLSRPEVDVCMTGPANAEQMREALRALELGPMSPDELAWMRRIGDAIYGKKRAL
ncbi:MAG: hypothetical protein ACM3ZB_00255 [bacterium]|jgi:aryl-alcohol dehydrogenase-like predicted oxidoreductase